MLNLKRLREGCGPVLRLGPPHAAVPRKAPLHRRHVCVQRRCRRQSPPLPARWTICWGACVGVRGRAAAACLAWGGRRRPSAAAAASCDGVPTVGRGAFLRTSAPTPSLPHWWTRSTSQLARCLYCCVRRLCVRPHVWPRASFHGRWGGHLPYAFSVTFDAPHGPCAGSVGVGARIWRRSSSWLPKVVRYRSRRNGSSRYRSPVGILKYGALHGGLSDTLRRCARSSCVPHLPQLAHACSA